ncbi:glycosyltransferase [candidate division KSB1 bacterium]
MRYLLTGGGTGGHVYPALAIREIIQEDDRDAEFIYVGIEGKAEEYILNALDEPSKIPLHFIHAIGLPRSFAPFRIFTFFRHLLKGCIESSGIIRSFNPDIIVATGGYVTAPVILAGRLHRKKIIIHEQNSAPGLVNKILGRFAHRILVTFEETISFFRKDKCVLSGYPVRRRIVRSSKEHARETLGIPSEANAVLIFGGSTGAKIINETIARNIELLIAHENFVVIHGTGRDRPGVYTAYSDTVAMIKGSNAADVLQRQYIIKDFFHDIDTIYSAVDLVVCRAGAGTLMECASIGIPMIIIPKRGLPGNHQEKNAQAAEKTGGAAIVYEEHHKQESIIDAERLIKLIHETISDNERLTQMSADIQHLFIHNTSKHILDTVHELLNGTNRE